MTPRGPARPVRVGPPRFGGDKRNNNFADHGMNPCCGGTLPASGQPMRGQRRSAGPARAPAGRADMSNPGHRAMQAAYLWILASLVTALGITGLVYLVSERSEREAGRMIITAQNGTGYVAVVVGGLAQRHGRPAP